MTLYFYNYNNYANRIYKKENTLAAYGIPLVTLTGVDGFNPGDGINATHVMNSTALLANSPDYMIAVDNDGNIDSRWFVLDGTYTRRGQYIVSLKRDVLADFDFFKEAPCFIEKATLGDNDSFIFNSESMTFNQIKTKEDLLMDDTKSAWLVGYYAKNIESDYLSGTLPRNTVDTSIHINKPIEEWEFYRYLDTPFKGSLRIDYLSLTVRKIIPLFSVGDVIEARIQPGKGSTFITRENR